MKGTIYLVVKYIIVLMLSHKSLTICCTAKQEHIMFHINDTEMAPPEPFDPLVRSVLKVNANL